MKWDKDPTAMTVEESNSTGLQVGKVSFYCVMKDARGMKSVVGEYTGLSHVTTQQKFYVGYVNWLCIFYPHRFSHIAEMLDL